MIDVLCNGAAYAAPFSFSGPTSSESRILWPWHSDCFPFALQQNPPLSRSGCTSSPAARCRCSIVENRRARRLTLRIDSGGRGLRVTVPPGVAWREVDRFLSRHQDWLEQAPCQGSGSAERPPRHQAAAQGCAAQDRARTGNTRNRDGLQEDRRAFAYRPWRAPAPFAPPVRFPEAPGQARHRGAGREAHDDDPQARQGDPLPRHGQPLGFLHLGRERCPFPGAS